MRAFVCRSSQVARLPYRSVNVSIRASSYRPFTPLQSTSFRPCFPIRSYASLRPDDQKKKKPESRKDGGKANNKDDNELTKDGRQASEDAESSKQDGKGSQINFSASPTPQEAEPPKDGEAGSQRVPGNLPLNAGEKKMLDDFLAHAKDTLPESSFKEFEKVIKDVAQYGVSPELRGLLNATRGKRLNIVTAMRLIREVTRVAYRVDQMNRGDAEDGPKPTAEDQQQQQQQPPSGSSGGSTPPPPPPPKSDGKQNKKQGSGFSDFNFKLDTNQIIVSALVMFLFSRYLMPSENSKEITWQEFRTTFLDKGLVEKIVVLNGNRAKVYLHREAVASMYPESPAVHSNFFYYFSIGSVEAFERRVDEAQKELNIPSSERIPVAYQDDVPWFAAVLQFGPTLLFIAAILWLSRRAASSAGGQSGIFGMGRSRAKRFNHESDIKVKFADVAGMDEAKQEIMEFVSFLKEPGVYQRLGAKIPRGAILSGPPGTGKTLLAKATAGESEVPFFSVSGSEFVEMFVGVGPSRVRDLFATARKNTPCIIFIDEIDAIGRSRSKNNYGGGNDERESTLNQILTEMDGFNTSEQVVVMAGTNRPDVLDKALLRPGRFDRHITIDKPTMDGRKQIFAVHLKKVVTKEDMEHLKGRLAALTPGFSGADIANCVNEAALIAARHKADSVEMTHFEQAIERVIGGLERKSLVLSPEEKKTVAYHEAGHAICGWYFKWADPLLKVSIIPRGQGALGYAQYLPNGDTYLMNVNQMMDRMAMTLGGRVSEELHFDTVTSGASDDFKKVTQMATAMVTRFGMSRKIGYLSFDDDSQQLHKPFSEETAKNIDSEVRRIVEEAYKQCRDLLTEKKKEVGLVAEELLRKEMLVRDDLVKLLGPRPFEEKGEFSKYFDGSATTPVIPDIIQDEQHPGGTQPSPAAFKRHFV